jgi:hypothetical protein
MTASTTYYLCIENTLNKEILLQGALLNYDLAPIKNFFDKLLARKVPIRKSLPQSYSESIQETFINLGLYVRTDTLKHVCIDLFFPSFNKPIFHKLILTKKIPILFFELISSIFRLIVFIPCCIINYYHPCDKQHDPIYKLYVDFTKTPEKLNNIEFINIKFYEIQKTSVTKEVNYKKIELGGYNFCQYEGIVLDSINKLNKDGKKILIEQEKWTVFQTLYPLSNSLADKYEFIET